MPTTVYTAAIDAGLLRALGAHKRKGWKARRTAIKVAGETVGHIKRGQIGLKVVLTDPPTHPVANKIAMAILNAG